MVQLFDDINSQETENVENNELYEMFKMKIDKLFEDFFSFYKTRGRGMEVTVKITKENFGGLHKEETVFDDKVKVIFLAEIGTKGKYENVFDEK